MAEASASVVWLKSQIYQCQSNGFQFRENDCKLHASNIPLYLFKNTFISATWIRRSAPTTLESLLSFCHQLCRLFFKNVIAVREVSKSWTKVFSQSYRCCHTLIDDNEQTRLKWPTEIKYSTACKIKHAIENWMGHPPVFTYHEQLDETSNESHQPSQITMSAISRKNTATWKSAQSDRQQNESSIQMASWHHIDCISVYVKLALCERAFTHHDWWKSKIDSSRSIIDVAQTTCEQVNRKRDSESESPQPLWFCCVF